MLQDFLKLFNAISTEEELANFPNVSRLQRFAAQILSNRHYLPKSCPKPRERQTFKKVLLQNFPAAKEDNLDKFSQSSASPVETSDCFASVNSTRILHSLLFEGKELQKREKCPENLPTATGSCVVMTPSTSISNSESEIADESGDRQGSAASSSNVASKMTAREQGYYRGESSAVVKPLQKAKPSSHTNPHQFEHELVQLPKKVARIIQPKITSHLRWSADYVYHFVDNQTRWFSVFQYAWFRLLIVSMAEHGLEFVYTKSKDTFGSLSTGETVPPWIENSKDPKRILTTKSDADDVLKCINWLQELKLTQKDYKELRELILLSGPDANDFASQTYRYFYTRFCLSRPNFEDNTVDSVRLSNTIVKLSEMKAEAIAGLLCRHLRGEIGRDIVLTEEMLASINDTESHATEPSSQSIFSSSSLQQQIIHSFLKMVGRNSQPGGEILFR